MKFYVKKNINYVLILFLVFTMVIVIDITKKTVRRSKLRNYKEACAIYLKDIVGVGQYGSYYSFKNFKNKEIIFLEQKVYKSLHKGDTVLIKYSIEDSNIAEVIDPCYMQ